MSLNPLATGCPVSGQGRAVTDLVEPLELPASHAVTGLLRARDQDGSLQRSELSQRRLGSDSLVWKYFGDKRLNLLGGRAGTTENMHPQLGQAVSDYSVIFTNLLERVQRSVPPIMQTVYGPAGDAEKTGLRIRNFHKPLKGTVAAESSLFHGTEYHGLDPETFYWAHATFLDMLYQGVERFIKPLSLAEKEQIFQESRDWYSMYGVDDSPQPQTYLEFQDYWDRIVADELVGDTKVAQYTVGYVTKGITRAFPTPKHIPNWAWNRLIAPPIDAFASFVGAGGLDPALREKLGIAWTKRQERRYTWFCAILRAARPIIDRLPLKTHFDLEAVAAFKREEVHPRKISVRRGNYAQ